MKPSSALSQKAQAMRAAAARFGAGNLRVFGSAARGVDRPDSDLDLIVDPSPTTSLFDIAGLQIELENILGVRVDLHTPGELPPRFRDRVLKEARPLMQRG